VDKDAAILPICLQLVECPETLPARQPKRRPHTLALTSDTDTPSLKAYKKNITKRLDILNRTVYTLYQATGLKKYTRPDKLQLTSSRTVAMHAGDMPKRINGNTVATLPLLSRVGLTNTRKPSKNERRLIAPTAEPKKNPEPYWLRNSTKKTQQDQALGGTRMTAAHWNALYDELIDAEELNWPVENPEPVTFDDYQRGIESEISLLDDDGS
jgi:hypothetical protein